VTPRPSAAAYIGRFAPSPSGPLHLGSIITALASHLEARKRGGQWLVRIEDIDRQRERPGAGDAILRELERLGLHWDGPVLHQRSRLDAYRDAIDALRASGLVYACGCSRREIGGGPYPGNCRERELEWRAGRALRLRVPAVGVEVHDRLQGVYRQALAAECGDFVLWRADGDPAYHLAVVVDDAWQGVTDVVRGADLLDSTPRQIHLQRLLGLATPGYCHLPVALDALGRKLSKQTADTAVTRSAPAEVLATALAFLGHPLPPALLGASPDEVLGWAVTAWDLAHVPANSRRVRLMSSGAGDSASV
jgi:glutamyl-Q tRNA(Asp) synthetase